VSHWSVISIQEIFLALLKYLEKFDPVMREHLDSVSGKPGCLLNFSPDIQDELINLLGARVRQNFISSIQKETYYSTMFDTTPDNAHIEQMSHLSELLRFSVTLWKSRKLLLTLFHLM
jgi:hypothetical protein